MIAVANYQHAMNINSMNRQMMQGGVHHHPHYQPMQQPMLYTY